MHVKKQLVNSICASVLAVIMVIAPAFAVQASEVREDTLLLDGATYGKNFFLNCVNAYADLAFDDTQTAAPRSIEYNYNLALDLPPDYLLSLIGSNPSVSPDLISLLANSGIDLSFGIDFLSSLAWADASYSVDGSNIANANMIFSGEKAYISSPELLTQSLSTTLPGINTDELLELISAPFTTFKDYSALKPAFKAIAAAAAERLQFRLDSGSAFVLGYQEIQLDAVAFGISEATLNQIETDAINILLADETAIAAINDFANPYGLPGIDIRADLTQELAALEAAQPNADTEIIAEVKIYINSENEPAGFGIESYGIENYNEDAGFAGESGSLTSWFVWDSEKGYELSIESSDTKLRLYGGLSEGAVKYGDLRIDYRDEYKSFGGKLLTLTGLSKSGVTITATLDDIMTALAVDRALLEPYSRYTDGLTLVATIDSEYNGDAAQGGATFLLTNAESASIRLVMNAEVNGETTALIPLNAAEVADADSAMQYLNLGGILNAAEKLSFMGYDISELVSLIVGR